MLEEIPTTTSSASAMVYEPQPAILAWLRRSAHKSVLKTRCWHTISRESRLCRRARRCRCDYGRRGRPSEPEPALRGENRTSTIHGCLEADGWRLEALDSPSNGDQGRLTLGAAVRKPRLHIAVKAMLVIWYFSLLPHILMPVLHWEAGVAAMAIFAVTEDRYST